MISERDWQEERAYLTKVQSFILQEIRKAEIVTGERHGNLVSNRRFMWENVMHDAESFEAVVEAAQHVVDLAQQEREQQIAESQLQRFARMVQTPYFGSMDFQEQGRMDAERIYVGISSLLDESEDTPLVYDWRAPIASMYYDFGFGQASYESPVGPVAGSIELKRQYQIIAGHLEGMFESDVRIGDDVLQALLSKHTDDKMRSIVTSIQKEQNQAIRNLSHRVFIVQGPAGSGKTSIALQRVAYLLYRHRQWMTADNILLFAPNDIFHDYVSNVLPELGESNMLQTTFQDYMLAILKPTVQLEDFYTHMEYILAGDFSDEFYRARMRNVAYKFSRSFHELLHGHLAQLETSGMPFEDLVYEGKVVVSAEEMAEQFYGPLKRYRNPARIQHLRTYVERKLSQLEEKKLKQFVKRAMKSTKYIGTDEEIQQMARKQVGHHMKIMRRMFHRSVHTLPIRAYQNLFDGRYTEAAITSLDKLETRPCAGRLNAEEAWSAIQQFTLASMASERIGYEDAVPLMFMHVMILGASVKDDIRHVLVDEAQDYTALQYQMMQQTFRRASFTILGDLHQSIHPYIHAEDFHHSGELFGDDQFAITRLTKSYRSTEDIVRFTQSILGNRASGAVEPVHRTGSKPRISVTPGESLVDRVVEEVTRLQADGAQSIAVICRTHQEAKALWTACEGVLSGHLIDKNDRAFRTGLVFIASYLAKGLEFDAVVIHNAADYRENEKLLFYTACTRALHELTILTTTERPTLLSEVDPELLAQTV